MNIQKRDIQLYQEILNTIEEMFLRIFDLVPNTFEKIVLVASSNNKIELRIFD